ncbi:MAG: hypothetical protein IJO73_02410 [Clostridia bacterium]|nr:hypothetical protein [Clostridia bacterium]
MGKPKSRKKKKYGINFYRYKELENYCLQYDEKKSELQQIYTSSSVTPEIAVMGGISGKPTEQKAMRALKLKSEIELIERCIVEACGEDVGIVEKLKINVTLGFGYDAIGRPPCGPRQFYEYRRKFFFILDKEKI